MTTKTKIQLTAGYGILAFAMTLFIGSCLNGRKTIHLYEAKMANTTCYGCNAESYEIGSSEAWRVGDSVIVDETNFVDMYDSDGRIYVITKDNGVIIK